VSIPTSAQSLARIFAAVLLGVQASACGRGNIVLGERGGTLTAGESGSGSSVAEAGAAASGTSGAAAAIGQAGAAEKSDSGATATQGTSGTVSQAGAPGAGVSGSVADAGPGRATARPSMGCGKDPALADASVTVFGMRSTYLVDLPIGYDMARAYPLVLAFRGSDATAQEFRTRLNFASVAGSEAIAVYPNPLNDSVTWDFMRDMPIFGALVPKVKSDYCIDEDRVFVLGDGPGALFANLIGCLNADEVRAIAPLAGAPPPPGPCTGNAAVWLLQSTSDPMMLGAGRANRDFWAGRNSCDGRMPMPVAPAPCVAFAGCDARFPVHYCEYDGDQLPGFAVSGAWDFFKSL
jgi:hypothetical protein